MEESFWIGARERRRSKRHPFVNITGLVIGFDEKEYGWILDLSSEGVSFGYFAEGRSKRTMESMKFGLFCASIALEIPALPGRCVYDEVLSRSVFGDTIMRKCGVEFKDMTPEQRDKLSVFVHECGKRRHYRSPLEKEMEDGEEKGSFTN